MNKFSAILGMAGLLAGAYIVNPQQDHAWSGEVGQHGAQAADIPSNERCALCHGDDRQDPELMPAVFRNSYPLNEEAGDAVGTASIRTGSLKM